MTTPIRLMSHKQLETLIRDAKNELNARRKADVTPESMNATIRAYQQAQGREDGEEWEQPVSALGAYMKGAEVLYEGERWVSTHDNNVHRPGVSGWRLKAKTDEDGNDIPPPFVPPTGAHDSYQQGERVTHNGQVWEAVRDGVIHSPDEYESDWKLVADEEESEPAPPENGEDGGGDPMEPDEPVTPAWEAGVDYQPGDRFIYGGAEYTVLQAHTSAAHWTPDAVPSLYERQG